MLIIIACGIAQGMRCALALRGTFVERRRRTLVEFAFQVEAFLATGIAAKGDAGVPTRGRHEGLFALVLRALFFGFQFSFARIFGFRFFLVDVFIARLRAFAANALSFLFHHLRFVPGLRGGLFLWFVLGAR